MPATTSSWWSRTGCDALITAEPSTVTSPSAISRAACVRDRARPRAARAASARVVSAASALSCGRPQPSGMSVWTVPAFEGRLQPVVQLGECDGARVQRLIFDHAQLGNEPVNGLKFVVVVVVRAHAATLPEWVNGRAPAEDDQPNCQPSRATKVQNYPLPSRLFLSTTSRATSRTTTPANTIAPVVALCWAEPLMRPRITATTPTAAKDQYTTANQP